MCLFLHLFIYLLNFVSTDCPWSMLLYCYSPLEINRPVNHMLLLTNMGRFLCRKSLVDGIWDLLVGKK